MITKCDSNSHLWDGCKCSHCSEENHNYLFNRFTAILSCKDCQNNFDNESDYFKYLMNLKSDVGNFDCVEIALLRIKSKTMIEELASNANWDWVKEHAVKKIINQELLLDIVLQDTNLKNNRSAPSIGGIALEKIVDIKVLETISQKHSQEYVRREAYNKAEKIKREKTIETIETITDQNLLEKYFMEYVSDPISIGYGSTVSSKALNRIDDQEVLKKIFVDSLNYKKDILKKIYDTEDDFLKNILADPNEKLDIKIIAANKLRDQEFLYEHGAIEHLTSDIYLAKVVLNSVDFGCWSTINRRDPDDDDGYVEGLSTYTLSRIHDTNILKMIIENSNHSIIRKYAYCKLTDPEKANELKRNIKKRGLFIIEQLTDPKETSN